MSPDSPQEGPPQGPVPIDRDNTIAVVVGIGFYPRIRNREQQTLPGAVNDAQEIFRFLEVDWNLPRDNIIDRISPPPDGFPLKDNVDAALRDALALARQKAAPRLFFYYAGHGRSSNPGEVALLMGNFADHRIREALRFAEYIRTLHRTGCLREQFFFLDCCRTRDSVVIGENPPEFHSCGQQDELPYNSFYAVPYRGEVNDRSPESTHGGSAFTWAMLEAFRGGAADEHGKIFLRNLNSYMANRLGLKFVHGPSWGSSDSVVAMAPPREQRVFLHCPQGSSGKKLRLSRDGARPVSFEVEIPGALTIECNMQPGGWNVELPIGTRRGPIFVKPIYREERDVD